MNTRAITAHIPNELAEQLDKISARIDRPKGWVELEEKRHQLTMESLTDVEANRIVEHESIKIWAANLDKTVD